jgi:hypothetical protein
MAGAHSLEASASSKEQQQQQHIYAEREAKNKELNLGKEVPFHDSAPRPISGSDSSGCCTGNPEECTLKCARGAAMSAPQAADAEKSS